MHKQIAHPPHPTSNGPPLVVTTEDERNKHYFTWHLFTSLATKRNLDSGSWVVIQCYNFSFQESRFQWIRKCYQTKILQVSYIILKGYWQKKNPGKTDVSSVVVRRFVLLTKCFAWCFLEPCIYSYICIVKHSPKQMYCTKAVTSDEIKNGCIIFDDKFEMWVLINLVLFLVSS